MANITIRRMRGYQVVEIDIDKPVQNDLQLLKEAWRELGREVIKNESSPNSRTYRNYGDNGV